jgi:hypothetical protein
VTITDPSDAVVLVVVVLSRLLVPLAIPRFPLPGILAALVLDAVDQSIFEAFSTIDLAGYQTYDKALDVYYLTIAYASTIRNWGGGHAFVVGRFLWYYRLVGVAAFELTELRWLLFVFPNTFEYFFVAVEAVKVARNPFRFGRRQVVAAAAAIWIVVKLPQEWWLHVAQLDLTDAVKEHVLGVPVDAPWTVALGNRPVLVVLSVVAAIAAAAALRGAATRWLPPRDWQPTMSADAQGEHLGWVVPSTVAVPSAFFGWAFVEKVALVTCVTLIFGQILPGADRSVVRVVVGTTLVIAASTVISQWLAGRQVSWRSTGVEFVVMGGANTAIGVTAYLLLPAAGPPPPAGTFLFLVGLLTLIVVLFDRFTFIARHPSRQPVPWRRVLAHHRSTVGR